MNIANKIVANAIKAQTARNSVEVEVSLMYAGRVQHAMRDAVRTVSGVRMASTNTLICPDEDAADEVVDILEQAGVPKREISLNAKNAANATYKWSSTEAKVGDRVRVVGALGTYIVTKVDGEWIEIKDADDGTLQDRVMARFAIPVKNAKRTARNERLVPFNRDAVKVGDSVWYKGREFEYKGSHGSLLVELEDVFNGEAEFVSPYDRNLKMAANARRTARNANEWIDDPKKKKAMDEIDKKADALYRQLKDIARKFDALKNEQVKVGFYFADYSDAARQIREIHGME